MNAHKGDVSLKIGDGVYLLRYTWDAIGELHAEFGSDFSTEIVNAMENFEMPKLAKALEIGLKYHHGGDIGVAEIMELSPPILEAQMAVQLAMNRAQFGAKGAPSENPKMAERIRIMFRMISMILFAKRSLWPTALD